MGREIERKFLVRRDLWRPDPGQGVRYRQGYLSTDPARVVRVRTAGERAYLTIKGLTAGLERAEYEYPIPLADADALLDSICLRPIIEKTRYRIPYGDRVWEVDDFAGENAGLLIAEVELPEPDAKFERPPWLGDEVSADPRYFNSSLIAHPYSRWVT
jgi:CYTH domain-containing protein